MLHYVPARLQDNCVLQVAEWHRSFEMDSTPNLVWNMYHLFDDRNPVVPRERFAARL
jgi:hypothetical protein